MTHALTNLGVFIPASRGPSILVIIYGSAHVRFWTQNNQIIHSFRNKPPYFYSLFVAIEIKDPSRLLTFAMFFLR